MGSATIDEINALNQMKVDLERKTEEWKTLSEKYKRTTQQEIPSRKNKFKEEAWNQILKANESNYQRAFEGLRSNKDKFVDVLNRRIAGILNHEGSVCTRDDLSARAKALYSGDNEQCSILSLNIETWLNDINRIRTDPIWTTVIVGNEDIDIGGLIKKLGNSPWVDQGRKYMRIGSKTCPFCQQETITDVFREKIEAFFDEEYNRQIDRINELITTYHIAANYIISMIEETAQNENALIIGNLDRSFLFAKTELLKSLLSEHERIMREKVKEPNRKVSIPDVELEIMEIQDLLNSANEKIEAYNILVQERSTEKQKLTDDVWATLIHESDVLIKNYQKDLENLEKKARGIKKTVDSLSDYIDELTEKIVEKGKNITSVQPTIDEINRLLKAYGFTSFSIQPADGKENYYCIKRTDGTFATDTLSEGEETFLTFLYFMQWTKGSTDPEHVSDKKIIVLDDPISSLDSTVLYIVGAMVKELWRKIKAGVGDVSQLFVLTHNTFFHKEASFDPRQNLGENINFWIIRKDNDISSIYNCGKDNPISTSYELLWKEIRENQHISTISLQNTMRRIIENYFGILGKRKDEEILASFKTAEEQMIAKSLLNWINDGSHSIPDDLHIDSYTDAVPKYRNVFKEIFYASGHDAHYDMMMGIKNTEDNTD